MRLPSAVSLAVAVVAISGCAGANNDAPNHGNLVSARTGPQLLKDAGKALVASGAVHITGRTEFTTSNQTVLATELDVRVQKDGARVQLKGDDETVDYVAIGDRLYSRTTGAGGSLGAEHDGRWISTNAKDSAVQWTLESVVEQFVSGDYLGVARDEVTSTTVDGRPAVIVTYSRGARLWVAASGKPLPLRLDAPKGSTVDLDAADASKGEDGPIAATFSDYGQRIPLSVPLPR